MQAINRQEYEETEFVMIIAYRVIPMASHLSKVGFTYLTSLNSHNRSIKWEYTLPQFRLRKVVIFPRFNN